MAQAGGIFDDTSIEFTTNIETTGNINVRMTFSSNNVNFTGVTNSTDEVILSGVTDPIVNTDVANKRYVDNEIFNNVVTLYGYDSVGGVSILTTPQTMIFNNAEVNDTGITLNTSSGVITLVETGLYEISYRVQAESVSSAGPKNTAFSGSVGVSPLGSTSTFNLISGSECSTYVEVINSIGAVAYGCGKTVLYEATSANTTMRIAFFQGPASSDIRTRADESSVVVRRLRT